MNDAIKPKLAFVWCSSCGGCEEAIVDIGEEILDLTDSVEIVYWPFALDLKRLDLEQLENEQIEISMINGAIRSDEQREISETLRARSKLVVAMGSCAVDGGVPALANMMPRRELLRAAYLESPTLMNSAAQVPETSMPIDGIEATQPSIWESVHRLDQVIDVDYFIPGCPPSPEIIGQAMKMLLEPGSGPARRSYLAPTQPLCDSCPRRDTRRRGAQIEKVFLPHEIHADPERCLLEQGLPCFGPATRSGCGELCIRANMPCTGCFGPPPHIKDQGAKMMSAIASMFTARTRREAEKAARSVIDPAGTFYRYSLTRAGLKR